MSERLLTYRVQIAGQGDFARDLKSILQLGQKAAEEQTRLDRMTAERRRKIKTDEHKHEAALLRTQLAIEKARARESERDYQRHQQSLTKTQQSFEKARAREATRAEKDKTRAAEREARARAQNVATFHRETLRQHQADLREFERHEREKTRVFEREARQRARQTERASRDAMFDSKRLYRGVFGSMAQGSHAALGIVGGYVSKGVQSISSGLGLNDTLDMSSALSEAMLVRKLARDVLVESRVAGGKIIGGQSYDANGKKLFNEADAVAKIRAASLATNTSQAEIAKALDVYSAMGSGAKGIETIDTIAKQGKLLGGADVVAKLRAQMDISSEGKLSESSKDKVIAQMHFLGKMGVFRASEMAKESELLFSRFAASGMDFESGMGRYVQFANLAKTSTGSAAMARTAINAVQNQIAKKEGAIKALGVKTRFTDTEGVEHQRDFIDIVLDVMEKTGGEGAYNKIFDPSRSGQALAGMKAAFTNAGKGKKGRARVEEMLKGALPSGMDGAALVKEMDQDIGAVMDTPAERLNKASLEIKDAIVQELLPAVEKLAARAPEIAKMISGAVKEIGSIARFAFENPKTALATVASVGALGSLGKGGAVALARFGGDRLAQLGHTLSMRSKGILGQVGGAAAAVSGNAISQAGATPVFITGVAPGVSLGGEGLGGGGPAGLLGKGGPAGAMGAAMGAIGLGFGAFMTLAPVLQEHLEKARDRGATQDDMDELRAVKAKENLFFTDAVDVASGKVTDSQTKSASDTLAKYFPEYAKKIASGEMSTAEVGAEVLKGQVNAKPGQFIKGADGTLESAKLSEEKLAKILDALETLALSAQKASKSLNGVPGSAQSAFKPPGG